jgi:predicted enzyme related to lactoylglutathione lyase
LALKTTDDWCSAVNNKKGDTLSTQSNPVGWFEIPVRDMARAKAFYEHVFALELEEHQMGSSFMAWFPMKEGVVGAAGSLVKGEGYKPSLEGVLVYFTAPDIEATLSRAREKGGHLIAEKYSIGEYGFVALIQDSEGNRIGLHSRM